MSIFDKFVSRAKRHSSEDHGEEVTASIAEPLLANMRRGKNYLPIQEFRRVAQYLLAHDDEALEAAIDSGVMSLGGIEILRVTMPRSKMMTVAQLASMAGVTRRHMSRLLDAAEAPFVWEGKKKLYDFRCLEAMRDIVNE